jgi:hypothetical protein
MRKENCKGDEHNELPRGPLVGRLLYVHLTREALQSSAVSRHVIPATTRTAERWEKLAPPPQCSSIRHNRKFRKQVCQYKLSVRLTMTC